MRLVSVLAGTALVVALIGLGRADVASGRAAANTLTVCATGATYTTIKDALDAAAPTGDTIHVCAGTFSEQLVINKSVTLVGSGPTQTIIKAPSQLTPLQDIVTIGGGSGVSVDVSGFTISGPAPDGNCAVSDPNADPNIVPLLSGIFVRDGAHASIHGNVITDMRNSPLNGCQKGSGIRVGRDRRDLSTTGTADIVGNVIVHYQKTGIVVDGKGSSAKILNNTVTGEGPIPDLAQNGIQVSVGAAATVSNNRVTGNAYSGTADASSTGILLFGDLGDVLVSANTVTDSDNGVAAALVTGNVSVSGNTVSGGDFGITLSAAKGMQIVKNTVSKAGTFGLDADKDSSGNTFQSNAASGTTGDAHFDCHDGSSGDKTADTANTWKDNAGATSSPDGICSPKAPPTPEPEPTPTPTPEPGPAPPLDVAPPVVIVLPPIPNTPEASEEPPVVPVTPPGEQPAPPPPPEPAPPTPANPVQPFQPPGPVAVAKADEIITTMKKKELKSCAITLKARGQQKTLVARGVAHAPGAAGRGILVVRVGVLPAGQRLLSKQIGGATVDVRAACTTTANKLDVKVKTVRAVLRIEHTVTTPGSWVPDLPLLTPIGTRFVEQLAKRMVAVTKIRCDGYTATWPPSPVEQYRLSFARATVVCGMLRRAGVKVAPKLVAHGHLDPIATNSTEPGRAANRRVAVTFVHKVASRTSGT